MRTGHERITPVLVPLVFESGAKTAAELAMPSPTDPLWDVVEAVPFRSLEQIASALRWFGGMPRKSKVLLTNLRKDLMGLTEPRQVVITTHLYFDHILDRTIERCGLAGETKADSFASRLAFLERRGALDSSIVERLRQINRLRNRLAHDLFFDLADWDPRTIDWVRIVYRREPKIRKYRRLKHLLFFIAVATLLMEELYERHRWLALEDMQPPTS